MRTATAPTYQLSDPIDQKNFRHASAEAIRIHEAAGAQEILFSLAHGQIVWKRGQDLERYIAQIMTQPLLDGAQPMISAHQLQLSPRQGSGHQRSRRERRVVRRERHLDRRR